MTKPADRIEEIRQQIQACGCCLPQIDNWCWVHATEMVRAQNAQLSQLQAENETLWAALKQRDERDNPLVLHWQTMGKKWRHQRDTAVCDLSRERETVARLTEALTFIADGCLVPPDGGSPCWDDAIEAAREALSSAPSEKEVKS